MIEFKNNGRIERLIELSNECYESMLFANRNDWLDARRKTIGASDAASVMGISPWKTEAELWEEKVKGAKVDATNSDTRRGSLSEEHILSLYGIETGHDVFSGEGIILTSSLFPFMSCTLDGIDITDKDNPVVIEIKSVKFSHGEWGDDKIPDYYFTQLLHQLAVTGWSEAILLVRFCRNEEWENASERMYHVKSDDVKEQIDKLIRKEDRFWNEYVLKNRRPPCRMPTL